MLIALVACYAQVQVSNITADGRLVEDFGALDAVSWSQTVDSTFTVGVDVAPDTAAFQVAVSAPVWAVLSEVRRPDGSVALDVADWAGAFQLTGAFDGDRQTNTFNWPVRGADGPLVPGRWELTYDGGGRTDADIAVYRKVDPDLATGALAVRVALAEGYDRADVRDGVDAAIAGWQALLAPAGITLSATVHATTLDPLMSFVEGGDPSIRAFAEEHAGRGEVVVVIGDYVAIKPIVYGTAADTPGPLAPTEYNFVAVAWTNIAGIDGVASPDEIDLLATTMAHETGHYLGLPHPVESTWTSWDALDDTSECDTEPTCEAELGDNLMFPTLQDDVPTELTDDQVEVLHRYVGVL